MLITGTASFGFQLALKYRFIMRIYQAKTTTTPSPVPYVISFKFFGDLQNYTFLERLGPTEPEK